MESLNGIYCEENPCNFHLYILCMGIHGMRKGRQSLYSPGQGLQGHCSRGNITLSLVMWYSTVYQHTHFNLDCYMLSRRFLFSSFPQLHQIQSSRYHNYHSLLPFIYSPIQYFPNCKMHFYTIFKLLIKQNRAEWDIIQVIDTPLVLKNSQGIMLCL